MAVMPSRSLAWIPTVGLALCLVSGAAFGEPAPGPAPASAKGEGAATAPALSLTAAAEAAAQAAASDSVAQPAPAPAPERTSIPVSGGISADFMSHYVWRGFLLSDAFSVQPTVWGKFGDLMVSSWSSWADVDGGPAVEHDFTVDYTKAVHPRVNLSVGYINYFFPVFDEVRHSDEIYVVSAFVAPLNPTVKVYFDVHEGKGTYLNFGISHAIPLGTRGITATPSFAIGYNHEQWIDDSTFNDANFGLKVTIPVNAHLSLGPGIYYSKGLTDFDDVIPDKFYGGLSVAYTF